ncbi:MAG: nitroreductase family protein [Paludibacteraceae bacterium]
MLRELCEKIICILKLETEALHYTVCLLRYNASIRTNRDIKKMQYTLLRENHVIEKGMSMRTPKRGFGQQKVIALLHRLRKYYDLYGIEDKDFLIYPLSTIKNYIAYTEANGVSIPTIKHLFETLLTYTNIHSDQLVTCGGVKRINKKDILENNGGSFEDLLYSRHSIRYFAKDLPDKSIIEKALILAQQTPSACNRQSWKTHIYFGEQSHQLLRMQGGCNGFEDEIPCSIVISADMRAFLSYEPMQCYVDGGLYAMNLINALHYLGLGTIPLSLGFYHNKLSKIKTMFHIPKEEALICIVGVGNLLESFNVAESYRKNIRITNVYH